MSDKALSLFWFRRDLRLHDNHGLFEALDSGHPVQCIFIFDTHILDKLSDKKDARVEFIHDTLTELKSELQAKGSDLWIYYGKPLQVWQDIIENHKVKKIFYNNDYEPYAKKRDQAVAAFAEKQNIEMAGFKDHVIFEGHEVLKDDGDPYTVFTPYKRKWMARLEAGKSKGNYRDLKPFPSEKKLDNLHKNKGGQKMISLEEMGFQKTDIEIPSREVKRSVIKNYADQRDYPAEEGTSRLGVHFRFGTISIRQKAAASMALSETYLSELVWRDFYSQILNHFPHVVDRSFRPKYDNIDWRNNEDEFEAWCAGKTGYPIVDAGMRELNATGYMHNRVRMVTASFVTKHLLIDWRWGEAYFAEKLLDFDLASNNGGWQWAAGSGTDAAPYFRIFNPESQQKKFDKDCKYIKKWIGEWGTEDYPDPIVDHKKARERCLSTYKEALN